MKYRRGWKDGRLKQTNEQGEEGNIQMNKQAAVCVLGQKGLSTDGWADEVMESSLVPAARKPAVEPGVGASQAQERQPSPGSVCSKLPH